jgi:choline dehydrogenase-like flavoprotein
MKADGFDYVIVGAGAAGCVLANRLTADPAARVALVEAGPSDLGFPVNLKTSLPVGNIFLLPHARYNWQHEFSGGAGVGHRTLICPRGKLFGGCTSVNGTVYIRGHRSDYDDWAALGNPGWRWNDVLPFYKRQEDWRGPASPLHGQGGELTVERPRTHNPLSHRFVAAAVEAGHAANADFNGDTQDGYGLYHLNQRRGIRLSASRAFLHPVLQRPNLQVFADTLVERVEMTGRRAVGVRIAEPGGRRRLLTADVEVILAGGAINSPQLLMLSGIGPAAQLRRHGIAVVHDAPGVGANLQDHPTVFVARANPSAESYALSARSWPRVALSPLQYLLRRSGLLASNAAEAGGFVRTLPHLERPDVQMTFLVGLKGNARTIPREHGFMLLVQLLRPISRGRVELASARPDDKPVLHPAFLEHGDDVATLVRGLQVARRIFASPALAPVSGAELQPGAGIAGDADLAAFVRQQVGTAYHPVGTCRMGPAEDPLAVVDARLAVHGIKALRVVDASVMPTIIGGNTAAPSMMIGERGAAFVLAAQRGGVASAGRTEAVSLSG